MEHAVLALQKIIDASSRIVFFGGAGVSTESGIADFRSKDGLFSQKYRVPPETMLNRLYFDAHPDEFFAFYREKMLNLWAKPNKAHTTLAKLEQNGKLAAVITQNIDGLHQAAGSKNVIELHGSVFRNHCMDCGKPYGVEAVADPSQPIPRCSCGGIIKPDVVLYGEPLNDDLVDRAIGEIEQADTLIIAGTSLRVYPAAGLVHWFKGKHTVVINYDATDMDSVSKLNIRFPIGEVLSSIII